MEVQFTAEQEAQLAKFATKTGADAEHLVKDAVSRLLQEETPIPAAAPELPVLHLGAMKSLRRRDIYDMPVEPGERACKTGPGQCQFSVGFLST